MQEEDRKPARTNAQEEAEENPHAVPYSTGYGVPEPEYVQMQPNRFPPGAEVDNLPDTDRGNAEGEAHRESQSSTTEGAETSAGNTPSSTSNRSFIQRVFDILLGRNTG